MSGSSYKERQEEELEVLKAIYVGDVHDLRSKNAKWKVSHSIKTIKRSDDFNFNSKKHL